MDEQLLVALGYLSEMPLTYAVPAYFGSNRSDTEKYQRNGTASLIKVDGVKWALTNNHVLQGYRDAREIFPDLKFQLGNKIIEPLDLIISESKYYDIVVLDLTDIDASDLATGGNKPTAFYEVPDWPPSSVTESDLLIIGGFPGRWRQENGKTRFRAFTFSQAGAKVESVSDEAIYCSLDLQKCQNILSEAFEEHVFKADEFSNQELASSIYLGGMSGGPVFIYKNSAQGIGMIHFVGILQEFQQSWEVMRIVPACLISRSGQIKDAPPSFVQKDSHAA